MQGRKSVLEKLRKRCARSAKGARGAGKARSGFTLVELIVVLALIGLLAAISAGGMVGYSLYATYKRNNENAKTLFSAAQSAITYYKASGKLENLNEQILGLADHTPTYVPQDAFADIDTSEGSGSRKNYDTISYLMMSNADYEKIENAVKSNTALEDVDPQTQLLFELLSDYVTDVSIYNASICVEFDAVDGVVSGVFYCDKDQDFSYGESADGINITKRDESYRRRTGLGYYSTELSEIAPTKVEALEIEAARVVNAESLDVQWFLEKKYQYMKGAQSYTIELFDREGGTDGKLAEIELAPDNVGLITREAGGQPYVDATRVTLYNEAGKDHELKASDSAGADVPVRFHAYLVQDDSKDDYGSGIALSLDVMDSYLVDAEKIEDSESRQKALMSTYSARRLSYTEGDVHYGLSLDGKQTVYAKVTVNSNADGEKSTSGENVFFAGYTDGDPASGESASYEIENARHLYNVGFLEQDAAKAAGGSSSETAKVSYKITNSFGWGGPDGLLSLGGVGSSVSETVSGRSTAKFYNRQNAYEIVDEGGRVRYPAFPGIACLNKNSVLTSAAPAESGGGEKKDDGEDAESESGPPWTIDYLTLEPQRAEGSPTVLSKTGLVQENYGTIENLKLENVDVHGIVSAGAGAYYSGEDVGAFCGRNEGTIQGVETVSGYVNGGKNVGGIVGSLADGTTISRVKNGAEVSGIENVGGIVGVLDGGTAVLSDVQNSGITYGWEVPEGASLTRTDTTTGLVATGTAPRYIGGIAGYVNNASITGAVSNPVPQEGDAEGGVLSAEAVAARLHGDYVGGIAGYLTGSAKLENCAVGSDGSSSYILGENVVGGVAGMYAGTDANALAGGSPGTCSANVIGRRFVGGIVGVNGMIAEGAEPGTAGHAQITGGVATVSGWTFNGLVMAANEDRMKDAAYVGGIAGVNAGTIQNCNANLTSTASELFGSLGGVYADFVGGIAGCNKGDASGDTVVTGSVAGRNFVGGVTGYNDGTEGKGTLSDSAGTADMVVVGNDFVGGVTGLNTSVALFSQPKLEWSVTGVSGNSYVGGYAGANIIAPSTELAVQINGSAAVVEAKSAFAGGLFGYNRLVTQDRLNSLFARNADGTAGDVAEMLDAAGETMDGTAGTDPLYPAQAVFGIDEADRALALSGGSLEITGEAGSAASGEQVPSVSAQVFAGGVIGYNAAQTKLTIKNYTGSTAVKATGSLADSDVTAFAKYNRDGESRSYSFSGGITGYVTENTVLENCSLAEGAVVETDSATYLGGLAEVNEGQILDSVIQNAGNQQRDRVGGIVGINGYAGAEETGKKALIKNCAAAAVYGNSVVGGVAAENYGEIDVSAATATAVGADGTDVGGVAGINYGIINSEDSATGTETGIVVHSTNAVEANVGGIAGTNLGDISEINAKITVEGGSRTGGIAGVNEGQISDCVPSIPEKAVRTAYLGGIAGENRRGGTILMNSIAPESMSASSAAPFAAFIGGVAGVNYGTIDKYTVTEEGSTAGSGYASVKLDLSDAVESPATVGGIVGQNEGTVRNMLFSGSISGSGNAQAPTAYGGIAGVNTGNGIIENCKLGVGEGGTSSPLKITVNGSGYAGGVAGLNNGSAMIRSVCAFLDNMDVADDASQVAIETNGALATGGVVGCNDGNASVKDAYSGSKWTVTADGAVGPVGGIIGLHTSAWGLDTLENYADVTGDGQAAGGIVGRAALDAGTNPDAEVTLRECVNYGKVNALGLGKAGGILGEWASSAGGSISGCVNGRASAPLAGANPDPDNGDTEATITAEDTAGAAGIVGGFTTMGAGRSVEILSCTNFGVISSPYGAGIAALAGQQQLISVGNAVDARAMVNITDCANAGRIGAGGETSSGAGIAIYHSEKSGSIALTLNRCRNYGRPAADADDSQFAGLAANIAADGGLDVDGSRFSAGQITVKNSIGVADVKYPTVPKGEGTAYGTAAALYGGDKNVYYYSVDTDERGGKIPKILATAGLGAAVMYENGDILRADDGAEGVSEYLIARNALDAGESQPFDPNGDGYIQDCRGNYNRLESRLVTACLKLENGEGVDEALTPPATELKAANNGGYLEITWENGPLEEEGQEGEAGQDTGKKGIVYKTVLEMRLYETADEAKEAIDNNLKDEVVYRATFYGGKTTSHTVRVSPQWMNQYIVISVANYSYKNEPQEDPAKCSIKILPSLLDPEAEVRLNKDGNYELWLANKEKYSDTTNYILKFTVKAETKGESVRTTGTVTTQISLAQLPYPLTPENLTPLAADFFAEQPDVDVLLTFTDIQVCPPNLSGIGSADGEGSSGGEEEQASGSDVSPSAKKTLTALIPAMDREFIESADDGIGRDGNAVNFNMKVSPAIYRAEVLWDVEEGDNLLKNIVVSSAQQEIEGSSDDSGNVQSAGLIAKLAIPLELADGAARARVYPLAMNGGMAKLGDLVGSGLSLNDLVAKGYLVETAAAVPGQTAGGAQIGAVIDAGLQQETAAAEPQEEPEQGNLSGQENAPETIAETEETEPQKTLKELTAADGYVVERMSDGTFSVYYSPLLTSTAGRQNWVRSWEEPQKSETMPTSSGGAGGSGTKIGSASGRPASESESESETETETEMLTEEETETELTQTETQAPQTETQAPQTESQAPWVLMPPQTAILVPDWDFSVGKTEQGEDKAVEEETFRSGLTLWSGLAPDAVSYNMLVGFYSDRPSLSSGSLQPDPQLLLTEAPGYDSKTNYTITAGGSYMFSNLPLSYAGKYMCVQLQSVSADGQTSEWSGYFWIQLPRIRLKAPELKAETETETHAMDVYEPLDDQGTLPETPATETVTLSHPAYSWEQEVPRNGELKKSGEDACGYLIELYRMLEEGVPEDSDVYKDPTAVVNLMCAGESGAPYYLERDWTEEEKLQWEEDHREDGLPLPVCKQIPATEILLDETEDEQIIGEMKSNPYLRIFEIELNEEALGHEGYKVTLSQDAPMGAGRREITLYPKLQIRRYADETGAVYTVRFRLILPDVEQLQEGNFLYDYEKVYVTHSVIVRQLLQSVYDEKVLNDGEEVIVADGMHCTYLLDERTKNPEEGSAESLRSYQRTLTPGWEYDKLTETQQDELDMLNSSSQGEQWVLLPRSYKTELFGSTGAAAAYAAAMQAAMQTDSPAEIANVDDELNFSFDVDGNMVQDTEGVSAGGWDAPGVDDQTIVQDDGVFDSGTDGGVIMEEEMISPEPQTQASAEPQTQAPTEPQTQTLTESQTQAPAEPQTSTELAPVEVSPIDASPETAMSLEVSDGEVGQ